MPVRRSLHRAPAFLDACLAKSRKSGGPRTPRGKAGPCLNALKQGRCAKGFRRLVLAHRREAVRLYDFVLGQVYLAFEPQTPFPAAGAERAGGPAVLLAPGAGAGDRPGNEAGMCPGINGFTKYAPIADWLGSVASSGVWLGCSLQRGCVLRSAPTAAWAGEPKEPIDKWQEPHYKASIGCVSFSGCQTT